ncbi:hypothetical protein GUITHDRAFT_164911 [Guillardia theta CCMP2712]|uniref:Uncharacterized protein n=1 Tax=Guillardia theta (strain CCMP2712) TaxID=905079 RepID=L1IU25_GUITC|nr:hypothetical protein GUITHDRAFT_164911 [Guillardia theta CCMP2712]EKX39617.1 hypothetical protein GUITHDRAFT_164911 [Guillardia theta CCMP2712]|mmetsp:Transcript_686/g.1807  ORF Transcript_686/g.1807 Transcript_686/m.1807 type:complete len:241 (-) Transcript_686:60-782(-)|eukprot:XP_005826597.1 hypothetical protein GUITHDRAFT_164911 [Guillardia theta CCMP2712]
MPAVPSPCVMGPGKQMEYGSTLEHQVDQRNNRKSIMFAICALSMVLAITALVDHSSESPQSRLEKVLTGSTKAKMHALSVAASLAAKKKASAPPAHPQAAHAAAQPASKKMEDALKARSIQKPSLKLSQHAAMMKVKMAHGNMLQSSNETAAPAPAPAPAASAASESEAAQPEQASGSKGSEEHEGVSGEDGNVDVSALKPTGIMGVFFNEKIMITAVCVIAGLLLAICCFAKYADCALA